MKTDLHALNMKMICVHTFIGRNKSKIVGKEVGRGREEGLVTNGSFF